MLPEPEFVNTNGIRLAVYEEGEGPAVILVHGFPELAFSWRHQIPALANAGFRAIAPEHIEAMKLPVADLTVEMLEPCGHWSQQGRPEDVNRLIVDWLGRKR